MGKPTEWLHHPWLMPVVLGLCAIMLTGGMIMGVAVFGGAIFPATNGGVVQAHSTSLTTYIAGAVEHPGVYTLPQGSRIADLLHAGGGAIEGADLVRVDLASLLFDGEEVYIPLIGEPFPDNAGSPILVNINVASAETMRLQLGISLKTAEAIVAYRDQHGQFTAVVQLLLVPISRSIYDRIKTLVTV